MAWHARLYRQTFTYFGSEPRPPADSLAYWMSVLGGLLFLASIALFWLTLNCATLFFGVFVEPLWRSDAKFRLLQLPGRIPLIAICLPLLLAYAAYRTYQIHGVSHVVGPFLLVAGSVIFFLGSISLFNVLRRRFCPAKSMRQG